MPKKTGVRCPSRKASRSNGLQRLHAQARPPRAKASRSCSGTSSRTRGSVGPLTGIAAPRRRRSGGSCCARGRRCPRRSRPRPIGQVIGARVERQRLLDLVEELERIARLAVHLVDEGDDRNVAQAADLEQLARARLDALGGVDHHDGGIDRGQRAIGVLGEVLVARRVEQVEDAVAVFERHHRGDDRDAALALDAHPVGARLAPVGLGACTSPASWIAPPNSSSFSVSVVLPASGCEMMAKVRRRLTGSGASIRSSGNSVTGICPIGGRKANGVVSSSPRAIKSGLPDLIVWIDGSRVNPTSMPGRRCPKGR